MQLKRILPLLVLIFAIASCSSTRNTAKTKSAYPGNSAGERVNPSAETFIRPLEIDRSEFVDFAKSLLGTPYKYASSSPANGLDCSGFIYYVFAHFKIKAPRSSIDYTNEGKTIDAAIALPGDIILFTGSDNSSGIVGHMGIITDNGPALKFIHSSSGKSAGVIISSLSGYYKTHFVKVIRILEK